MSDKNSNAKAKGLQRRSSKRVTMTDIAREAGCSQATVSFVLNQSSTVKLSTKTKERILQAVQKLGYVSSSKKATTTPIRSKSIGFIVDQLATSPEAINAIEGVCHAAQANGFLVLVSQTLGSTETEAETIQAMVAQGVSMLVFMTIFTRKIELSSKVYELDIPVLLLNCYSASKTLPTVIPSEVAGGQRSTQHLIKKGHRRIAIITGELWMEAAQDRLKGYRRALATADIPFDSSLVVEGDWSASSGYEATNKLLGLKNIPTAIFCQNDRTAIGCYEALKEAGLNIPRDMSVIGFDDEDISRHLHPQLTTSILPHRAMGQWAVEQFENLLNSDQSHHAIVKIECSLIERESVAKPRNT